MSLSAPAFAGIASVALSLLYAFACGFALQTAPRYVLVTVGAMALLHAALGVYYTRRGAFGDAAKIIREHR